MICSYGKQEILGEQFYVKPMRYQILLLVFCGLSTPFLSGSTCFPSKHCHMKKKYFYTKNRTQRSFINQGGYILGELAMDALRLNRYIFHVDTAKIITAFTPFYIITRSIDEDIQSRFYDPVLHKNINQIPRACYQIAKYGVGVPMVGLSAFIFSDDPDLRQTARLFIIGWPFVHWGKNLIKKINTKSCLRPWHEDFNSEKRARGGFPSGHMANVMYAATLFGLRHGPQWGIPLGLFATFVLVDFINCDRHYFSQLIAGAGLGVIYAFAANKVIEQKLSENFSFSMNTDDYGRPGVSLAYSF